MTVGESVAPQTQGTVSAKFHRIGAGVGVFLHDTEGNERGGMSWLSNGRGTISFDYPERDAIGMYVDDRDRSATFVLENPDAAVGEPLIGGLSLRSWLDGNREPLEASTLSSIGALCLHDCIVGIAFPE